MKQALIVALLCLNVALLLVLILGVGSAPAQAQAVGGRTDYLVTTGNIGTGWQATYLLDTATRRLAVLKFDRQSKRLQVAARSDLARDFARTEK